MARRSPARFLAPLALVAAVAATVIVVQSTRSSGGGDASSPARSTGATHKRGTKASGTSTTGTTTTRRTAKTYTVKSGDSLSTVSRRTGVSVSRIQELNPNVDPQALQVGQKIKLRPGARTSAGGSGTP